MNRDAATLQYDIVVVGGGGSGLAASARLAAAGKKVLLLEKQLKVGGSSAIASGQWAVSNSLLQKNLGISDSDELFLSDMLEVGKGFNSEALIKIFIKESRREFEELSRAGIQPVSIMANSAMTVPRGHLFNTSRLIEHYATRCREKGVEIITSAPAKRLLRDQSGRVYGVIAQIHGNTTKILSRYGVLLACGGFGRNKEMLKKYSPACLNAIPFCAEGSTGDGILMAQELGADLDNMGFVKPTYGFLTKPSAVRKKTSSFYAGAIIVNKFGKRFIAENISYKAIGERALLEADAASYVIMDETIRQNALATDPREKQYYEDLDKLEYGFKATSIDELARVLNMDPLVLKNTIHQYNITAPRGQDSLGRNTLTFKFGIPLPLTKPPYIALPATAALLTTYCGLKVNENLEVLNVWNEPIEYLFAAGEIMGGIHGAGAMSGSGYAKAFAFGSYAAEKMLKNRPLF